MKHVMLDLETLGTVADAVIMSIGAVKFDLESNRMDNGGFYASVSIESNLERGRRIQEDTLIWWMGQDAVARHVFAEPKQSLESALEELADWLSTQNYVVWSNGASFDIPMLEHAYKQAGIEVPWKFYDSQCVRTYRKLPGANKVPRVQPEVAHNALSDAVAQAKYVQAIHAELFGKVPA